MPEGTEPTLYLHRWNWDPLLTNDISGYIAVDTEIKQMQIKAKPLPFLQVPIHAGKSKWNKVVSTG